jgi:hypothetical protein
MKRIKGVELLKQELLSYQTEVIISIGHELERIGRKVQLAEMAYIPLPADLQLEISAVGLNTNGEPSFETNLDEFIEIEVIDYFSKRQVNHWDLVYLLELLKSVGGKEGQAPSHLKKLSEFLSFHPNFELHVCTCGNHERKEGFGRCDIDGNLLHSDTDSPYYRCECCGRVIEQGSHRVLGMNLNPDKY